jgi:hypothetical protein
MVKNEMSFFTVIDGGYAKHVFKTSSAAEPAVLVAHLVELVEVIIKKTETRINTKTKDLRWNDHAKYINTPRS